MSTISWSDLPKELLVAIGKRLDTCIDALRFRAVCSSWRSSISPPQKSPPLPLILPFPVYSSGIIRPERRGYFTLTESTIYRLEPPPNDTGSSKRNNWLVKVKESESSKVQILDLFESPIDQFPQTSSKVLNLLNFRIWEITKAYNLEYVDIDDIPVFSIYEDSEAEALTFRKVVVSSKPVSTAHDYAVIALNSVGILCYIKLGDDKWTIMNHIYNDGQLEPLFAYDIVDHKGQFYVVDQKGKVVVLNYSFEVAETFASPTFNYWPTYLQLFKSLGDLLLVDNYSNAVKIKFYKLDEEERKWNEVNSLGDRVLFLCHDCSFSVSVQDFPGYKGNCIYFIDEYLRMQCVKGYLSAFST